MTRTKLQSDYKSNYTDED